MDENINQALTPSKQKLPSFRPHMSFSKRSIVFISSILLLIGVVLTVYIASGNRLQDSRSRASSDEDADILTKNLIKEKGGAEKIIAGNKRKNAMKLLAKNNPEKFLLNALGEDAPSSLLNIEGMEKEIEKTGGIELANMESEEKNYIFVELKANGDIDNIYHLNLLPELEKKVKLGSRVKAKGYLIDDIFVPYSIKNEKQVLAVTTTPEGNEVHHVAVIPVNFSNNNNQEYTKAELEERFFNDPKSVHGYYNSVSFGKIIVTGKVFAPVNLSMSTNRFCNPDDLFSLLRIPTDAADDKIAARGESLSGFEHKAYIYPHISCNFIGQATIGNQDNKSFSRMMINGHTYNNDLLGRNRILIHEFGHNLGLGHADTFNCGDSSIKSFGNCSDNEYGDHSDIMGFQHYYFPGISAFNKRRLGFIPSGNLKVIDSSGEFDYELFTSSRKISNTQLIRIPIRNTGDEYYIDYRKKIGFDSNLTDNMVRGAMIKIGPTGSISTTNNIFKTYLIDTTPGDNPTYNSIGWFGNATLADGQGFVDSNNNISIKQISHDNDKVTLRIGVGEPVCVRNNPSVLISPLGRTGHSGERKTYEITIDNNDSLACPEATYALDVVLPSGWQDDLSSSISVKPKGTASIVFSVVSASNANDDVYNLVLKVGAMNGAVAVNKNFRYTVINNILTPTPTNIPTPTFTPTPSNTPTPETCVWRVPTITYGDTTLTGARNQTLTYKITISNNDNSICGSRKLGLNLVIPSELTRWTYLPKEVEIFPGETKTIDFNVTAGPYASNGTKTLNLSIFGLINGIIYSTKDLIYIVQ